jgi:hypothetical protein
MNYGPELLDRLRSAGPITVTGPQRAGTRIATRILAADLGRTFVGEEEYRVGEFDGVLERYLAFALGDVPSVIHAPALLPIAHYLPGIIVCMHRPLADIERSQQRIAWAYERYMLDRYFVSHGPIAGVAYWAWHVYQKPMIEARAIDLEYNSLAGHPLWLPAEQRAQFSPHQTEPLPIDTDNQGEHAEPIKASGASDTPSV